MRHGSPRDDTWPHATVGRMSTAADTATKEQVILVQTSACRSWKVSRKPKSCSSAQCECAGTFVSTVRIAQGHRMIRCALPVALTGSPAARQRLSIAEDLLKDENLR